MNTLEEHRTLLNKDVSFKYGNVDVTGTLDFVGRSEIADLFGSDYITYTISRTPYRVYNVERVNLTEFEHD